MVSAHSITYRRRALLFINLSSGVYLGFCKGSRYTLKNISLTQRELLRSLILSHHHVSHRMWLFIILLYTDIQID